ncbi:MAG: orotidine-5'-phosphate decarboxylase [bacterium]
MTGYAIPIVALDVPTAGDALAIARQLREDCHFFKVGSTLYTAAGPSIVRELREKLQADVFLDLKFHDIPNTVAGAVRSAASLGVRLVTVHASGGRAMLEAAQEGSGGRLGVLAVTVLTSFDDRSLAASWGRDSLQIEDEVMRLAADAAAAQLHGVVCSGEEARAVSRVHGDNLAILVPGIRLEGDQSNDQRRVMTPHAAQRAGAGYVVLGRTVTAAKDPKMAFRRVLVDLAQDTVDGMPAVG